MGHLSAALRRYFTDTLWHYDPSRMNLVQRRLLQAARVLTIVVRDFVRDNCLLRASALTFATLLSVVPMLAFAFSVLKGMGIQNRLEPLLMEHLNVGSEAVVARIIEYINNTNVGRLGTVGLGMLLMTVLALLSNIEKSFNYIWGVNETRTLLRRFADYFSVLAFAPLLMVVAISVTATVQNLALVVELRNSGLVGNLVSLTFKMLPYLALWIAFSFLYLFMPNIRVKVGAAILGGIFGGTLWQLVQLGYVHFQVGVARYNAIYGTMAVLPIFMVWMYISWIIVLLGAELSATVQNLESLSHKLRASRRPVRRPDIIGLAVMLCVVRAFRSGQTPIPVWQMATRLDLLVGQVETIAEELCAIGMLTRVEENATGIGYLPTHSPERLKVQEVLAAMRGELPEVQDREGARDWLLMQELIGDLVAAERQVLDGMTLLDLASRIAEDEAEDNAEEGCQEGQG